MGWILSSGLLVLGILLIAVVFVVGKNKARSGPKTTVQNKTLGSARRESPVEILPELQKYIQESDFRAIDRVIDGLESYPPDKQEIIRRFCRESTVVESYKTNLTDIDYKIRAISANRLGKIGGKDVSELLFRAMADRNEEVRLTATAALKHSGDASIAGLLVDALKEPNKWLPARVAEVLISLGQASTPALHAALKEDDPVFRGYVIEILGEIGDQSSGNALHQALRDDNCNIRLQAARALGQIGQRDSVNLLAQLLHDPEIKVKVQAIRSLGRIGGMEAAQCLTEILMSNNAVVRFAALNSLRQMGPEGMNVLKEAAFTAGHPAAGQAKEILREEEKLSTAKVNITYE